MRNALGQHAGGLLLFVAGPARRRHHQALRRQVHGHRGSGPCHRRTQMGRSPTLWSDQLQVCHHSNQCCAACLTIIDPSAPACACRAQSPDSRFLQVQARMILWVGSLMGPAGLGTTAFVQILQAKRFSRLDGQVSAHLRLSQQHLSVT